LQQLIAEGVEFQTGVNVGQDISARYLKKRFDCICLTMGAGQPRDLNIVGRDYENILFAMDYLKTQNKICNAEPLDESKIITAKNKVVVVIGGGDTGSDCVGTAKRQGAKQIYQLEILPKPPETRPDDTPWPTWPRIMRSSSSHEEGCERRWSVMTKKFSGVETRVTQLHGCQVQWQQQDGKWKLNELPDTDFVLQADLVLLAMGFTHVVHDGIVKELGLTLDPAGNLLTSNCQTSEPMVFAAGDSVSGASLVVRAIDSGRQTATTIDKWLRQKG
jgi:NADPH-dependent glutamate synthase beta subunit-like oxidoreductase